MLRPLFVRILLLASVFTSIITLLVIADNVSATPASSYGYELAGNPTASGDLFDPEAFTCAHKTVPFGTHVWVQNNVTQLGAEAVVNDRGPYVGDREWDCSLAVARAIGGLEAGVMDVTVTVL